MDFSQAFVCLLNLTTPANPAAVDPACALKMEQIEQQQKASKVEYFDLQKAEALAGDDGASSGVGTAINNQ